MTQLSKLEDLIIESPIIGQISSYLTLCDMKNLIISSKNLYMSSETRIIMRKNIHNRSSYIISKLLKKYYRIIENIKRVENNNYYIPCQKYFYMSPFFYYRYYPKEFLTDYFRCAKKKLLNYSNCISDTDNNKTRSELFKFICSMSVEDILYIGW